MVKRENTAGTQIATILVLWVLFAVLHWAIGVTAVTALVFVTGLQAVSAVLLLIAAWANKPAK